MLSLEILFAEPLLIKNTKMSILNSFENPNWCNYFLKGLSIFAFLVFYDLFY